MKTFLLISAAILGSGCELNKDDFSGKYELTEAQGVVSSFLIDKECNLTTENCKVKVNSNHLYINKDNSFTFDIDMNYSENNKYRGIITGHGSFQISGNLYLQNKQDKTVWMKWNTITECSSENSEKEKCKTSDVSGVEAKKIPYSLDGKNLMLQIPNYENDKIATILFTKL